MKRKRSGIPKAVARSRKRRQEWLDLDENIWALLCGCGRDQK